MYQRPFSLTALRASLLLVGERGFDLLTGLVALVLVERWLGEVALGTYSFLLAVYVLGTMLAAAGSARAIELRLPHDPQLAPQLISAGRTLAWQQAAATFAVLLLLLAFDGRQLTTINELAVAYPLLAASIALAGFNRLRLAVLHGLGSHDVAVRLQFGKRIGLLVSLLLLLQFNLRPSLLVACFLVAELVQAVAGRRAFPLPAGRANVALRSSLRQQGWRLLLSGETFSLLFYLDLFLLGLFVSSRKLGIYTEAALFGRLFLLLPVALQPLLRERCGALFTAGRHLQLLREQRLLQRGSFILHATLALWITVSFPRLLTWLYGLRNDFAQPLELLALMLPGLLLATTLAPVEALSEATGHDGELQRLTTQTLLLNLGLNLYLIPFAGPHGAAVATTLALGFHFLRFGYWLPQPLLPPKATLALAGGAVYLGYVLLHHLLPNGFGAAWAALPLILLLSAMAGLFSDSMPEAFAWPASPQGGMHART